MSPKSGMARRDTGSDRQAAVMPPSDLDLVQDLALDLDDDHASRVQTLLVSVRDLASSLYRLSAQLEREIGPSRPGTPPPGEQAAAAQELLRLRAEVAQLRGSIEARVVIEQAKGMLMADRGCSDQEAFDLLVGMSQAEQRKVREIAVELVAAGAARPSAVPVPPTPATIRPGLRIDLDDTGSAIPVGRQPGRPG